MPSDADHLDKLREYYARHRVLPSYSTVGGLVGFSSKGAVAELVLRLKQHRFIESTKDRRLKPGRRFFERPLASSKVEAGFPSPATEDMQDAITIDEYLVRHPAQTVLVVVKNDSMIDAGIFPGDIVVMEKRNTAQSGDIVVAIIDNDLTIKTLVKEGTRFVLVPANKAYPTLRPKELEIHGVVVGSFRKYK